MSALNKLFFVFCFLACFYLVEIQAANVKTIVIDAGHGGQDAGAVGAKHKEKDIALSVALKLGKMIQENFPDVKVVYTRDADYFVEVYKRPQIANKAKADLFMSIHCNSSKARIGTTPKQSLPKGFETFAMGLSKGAQNLEVVKRENGVILGEKNYMENYGGFDPNSPEAYIIFSLFQNVYLDQSLSFAEKIQRNYRLNVNSVDRGVKQDIFLVLHGCAMPSVLTELGFMNHPDEEAFMASDEGQEKLVKSLFNAFREYKYSVEGFNNQSETLLASTSSEPCPTPIPTVAQAKTVDTTKKQDTVVVSTINFTKEDFVEIPKTNTNKIDLVFKVQFASSSSDKPLNSAEFAKIDRVGKYQQGGMYKYTAGAEKNMEAAANVLRDMQKLGFTDAFIVVFKNGERISTAEAVELLKKDTDI